MKREAISPRTRVVLQNNLQPINLPASIALESEHLSPRICSPFPRVLKTNRMESPALSDRRLITPARRQQAGDGPNSVFLLEEFEGQSAKGEPEIQEVSEIRLDDLSPSSRPGVAEERPPPAPESDFKLHETAISAIELLRTRQYNIIKVWMTAIFFLEIILSLNALSMFASWSTPAQGFLIFRSLLITIQTIQLYKIHFKKKTELYFAQLMIINTVLFTSAIFQSLEADILVSDLTPEILVLMENFEHFTPFVMFLLIQAIFVTLEYINDPTQRRLFFVMITLPFSFYICLPYIKMAIIERGDDEHEEKPIVKIAFLTTILLITHAAFSWAIYRISSISNEIGGIELSETNKHLSMFNALRDSILLVRDNSLIFTNSVAKAFFLEQHPLTTHQFYVYSHFNSEQGSSFQGTTRSLSLNEIRSRNFPHQTIFTTSKQISDCTSLDQLQQIIAKIRQNEQSDDERPLFVSLNFIKIPSIEESEEVMIQIQDISYRILGQNLEIERQYLSIMNSTVSHEMRNPLNALLNSVEVQSRYVAKIVSAVTEEELSATGVPPRKTSSAVSTAVVSACKDIQKSLRVSSACGKLLKFNIEDILAMPQLQQGKFTKNYSAVNIKRSVDEVAEIMAFQAESKNIKVISEFFGFSSKEPKVLVLEQEDEAMSEDSTAKANVEDLPVKEAASQIIHFQRAKIETNIPTMPSRFADKPDNSSRIEVSIDEQRLQQILLNFLSNAIKFTPRGGSIDVFVHFVEVELPSRDGPDLNMDTGERRGLRSFIHQQQETVARMMAPGPRPKIVLSVSDTGVGISPEDQAKLFKLFGCLQATRQINTNGVGLGLAICKMIAEEFGGEVAVLSEKGAGSTFFASLEVQEHHRPSRPCQGTQESSLASKFERINQQLLKQARENLLQMEQTCSDLVSPAARILIVDDEAYNCEVLLAIISGLNLEDASSRVDRCLSGAEALALLSSSEEGIYKLILTDLSMPEMNGFEFCKRAKALLGEASPPIVALTGHTEPEYQEEAFAFGMDSIYCKPIHSDSIALLLTACGFRVKLKDSIRVKILG